MMWLPVLAALYTAGGSAEWGRQGDTLGLLADVEGWLEADGVAEALCSGLSRGTHAWLWSLINKSSWLQAVVPCTAAGLQQSVAALRQHWTVGRRMACLHRAACSWFGVVRLCGWVDIRCVMW